MMFREAIGGTLPPVNEAKLIDGHCNKLIEILQDRNVCQPIFERIARVFERARTIWVQELKKNRFGMKDIPEFTNLLLKGVRAEYSVKSVKYEKSLPVYTSAVAYTRLDRKGNWIGFISGDPEKIFFHEFYSKGLDFSSLGGKAVEFKLRKGTDGKWQAFELRLIPSPSN
jgi:hypothetical protein